MDAYELQEAGEAHKGKEQLSIEEIFEVQKLPSWKEQITFRGIIVSIGIGFVFSIIMTKLNLTTGLAVTMNVSAGLLGFIFLKSWTKVLKVAGFHPRTFTRQENTVIQTCVVACYSLSYGGGFGSYLLGMNRRTYDQAGGSETPGNSLESVKAPALGWIIGFLFLTSFVGLFVLLPLRKVLIVNPRLTYPSGTATAVLINNFHTPRGHKLAGEQVKSFVKFFAGSFLWGFFQWFFTAGDSCGFVNFPTFGLQALKQSFYFDFSMTYVGAGMICSHTVNLSLLAGAILSWGIMWPLIRNQKGNWYPADLKESSMKSLNGYKVFICIAVILGDGLFHFMKIAWVTASAVYEERRHKREINSASEEAERSKDDDKPADYDDRKRRDLFQRDTIPMWVAWAGYVSLAILSMSLIPRIMPGMTWYYVATAYVMAPLLAFCNAYGTGLTDQNLAYNYAKVALFAFAAWAADGPHPGRAVLVGLASCGLMKSMIAGASDLMHDFKTGYLTMSSPRSMLAGQLMGTALGCVIAPATFWMFYQTFDVGNPDGEYKAPYALVYRNMAILGVEGFSALPGHCLQLCIAAFVAAFLLDTLREFLPQRFHRFVPLPTAMAIPMLVGAYFAVDMCVGSLIVYLWQRVNPRRAEAYVPAVASGLMCGDGLWVLPASVLALFKVNPPICMRFLSRSANNRLTSSGLIG